MRARFDDPTSEFLVDWQFTDHRAKVLNYPIAFGSNHNDPLHVDMDQAGEVRQVFYSLARTRLPAVYKGDHVCGTKDQWQNGWPAGTPGTDVWPVLPRCCVGGKVFSMGGCSCSLGELFPGSSLEGCSCSAGEIVPASIDLHGCSCSAGKIVPVQRSLMGCSCAEGSRTAIGYSLSGCSCLQGTSTVGP